jgi:hypothetical protein
MLLAIIAALVVVLMVLLWGDAQRQRRELTVRVDRLIADAASASPLERSGSCGMPALALHP